MPFLFSSIFSNKIMRSFVVHMYAIMHLNGITYCEINRNIYTYTCNAFVYFRSSPVGMSSWERRWRRHLTVLLRQLLTGNTREANNYREPIREANSAMVFASMVAEINLQSGNYPYCFRIQVYIYNLVSPLHPNEANKPGLRQLHTYFQCYRSNNKTT
jgi:hypothetical protein